MNKSLSNMGIFSIRTVTTFLHLETLGSTSAVHLGAIWNRKSPIGKEKMRLEMWHKKTTKGHLFLLNTLLCLAWKSMTGVDRKSMSRLKTNQYWRSSRILSFLKTFTHSFIQEIFTQCQLCDKSESVSHSVQRVQDGEHVYTCGGFMLVVSDSLQSHGL